MQIREQLPKAKRMLAKIDRCNQKKYCLYHWDPDHDMEEYIQLQDEIEKLIHHSHLNRFIRDKR